MESSSSPSLAINGVFTGLTTLEESVVQDDVEVSPPYLESKGVTETKALAAELCHKFYTLGWVLGTGGSIAIKVHDDLVPKPAQLIVTSPSGIYHMCIYTYILSHIYV